MWPEPCALRVADELAHGDELVIAREDHRLLAHRAHALVGADLPLLDLQVDEAGEDVEQAVAREHLLPEIGGAVVAVRAGRIAGAVVVALLNGSQCVALPSSLVVMNDEIGIDGEVDERALLEAEQRQARIAVVGVLALGVLDGLAGHRVFQLGGDDRQAVERRARRRCSARSRD